MSPSNSKESCILFIHFLTLGTAQFLQILNFYLIEFWLSLRALIIQSGLPKSFSKVITQPHPLWSLSTWAIDGQRKETWALPRSVLPSTWKTKGKTSKAQYLCLEVVWELPCHHTQPSASHLSTARTAEIKVSWKNKVHIRGIGAKPLVSQEDERT